MEIELFKNKGYGSDLLNVVLKLPWTHHVVVTEPHPPRKAKCAALQVFSKLGQSMTESDSEILDLALCDEFDEVRAEAVISLPLIVMWSGLGVLTNVFKRLE